MQENKNLDTLQQTFAKLVKSFPSRVVNHKAKSDSQLSEELKAYTLGFTNLINNFSIKKPEAYKNENAPLYSEYELLSVVIIECSYLGLPSFNFQRFEEARNFVSNFEPLLLFKLLHSLDQRDQREARFIESIILSLSFEELSSFQRQASVLASLVNKQGGIKVIEDFESYNEISKAAYSFIRSLFEGKLFTAAFLLKDSSETEPKALLPKGIVQFGQVGKFYSRTFSVSNVAISAHCFEDLKKDRLPRKQRIAVLVVILVHQVFHLNVQKCKNSDDKPSEEHKEKGNYGPNFWQDFPNLSESLMERILNVESWRNSGFIDEIERLPTDPFAKKGWPKPPCNYFHQTWDPAKREKSNKELEEFFKKLMESNK